MEINTDDGSKGLWLMTGPSGDDTPAKIGLLFDWCRYDSDAHGWAISGGTPRGVFAVGWMPCLSASCPLRGMPKPLHHAIVLVGNLVDSLHACADTLALVARRARGFSRLSR
jgi:hypothetical protein